MWDSFRNHISGTKPRFRCNGLSMSHNSLRRLCALFLSRGLWFSKFDYFDVFFIQTALNADIVASMLYILPVV